MKLKENHSNETNKNLLLLAALISIAAGLGSTELTLGERLAHEYEKQAGLGSTPELEGISGYISSIGNRIAACFPRTLSTILCSIRILHSRVLLRFRTDTSSLAAACWLWRKRKTNWPMHLPMKLSTWNSAKRAAASQS